MDENVKQRLLDIMKLKSVRFGKVTLTSGKKSDWYVDTKNTTLCSEGGFLIGKLLYDKLSIYHCSAIAGVEMSGIPIAISISNYSYLHYRRMPALIIRKEAKKHGTQNRIEGLFNVPEGSTVVLIEDVVTTGCSALKAAKVLKTSGYDVFKIVTLIDREEGGRDNIERNGYDLYSLFTKSDFMEEMK